MAHGFTGKILHVDLSDGRHWVEEPDDAFYRQMMGGRALVAHYLLTLVPPGADPFGPENIFVMAPGIVTGSTFPGQGRTGVGAVMGSKNLKGLAIKAKGALPVNDKKPSLDLAKWMTENLDLTWHFHDVGTAGGLRSLSMAGGLPTYNFQEGSFEGNEKITGTTMRDTILIKRDTCYAC